MRPEKTRQTVNHDRCRSVSCRRRFPPCQLTLPRFERPVARSVSETAEIGCLDSQFRLAIGCCDGRRARRRRRPWPPSPNLVSGHVLHAQATPALGSQHNSAGEVRRGHDVAAGQVGAMRATRELVNGRAPRRTKEAHDPQLCLFLLIVVGAFWLVGTFALDYPAKTQAVDDLLGALRPAFTDTGSPRRTTTSRRPRCSPPTSKPKRCRRWRSSSV